MQQAKVLKEFMFGDVSFTTGQIVSVEVTRQTRIVIHTLAGAKVTMSVSDYRKLISEGKIQTL